MATNDSTSDIPQKTCTKCKQTFPATEEHFYKYTSRHGKPSLTGQCKVCKRKKGKEIRDKDPEKYRQASRDQYQKFKPKRDAANKEWAAKHPEKKRDIEKRYREKHPDKCRESNKAWLDKNPEKKREYTGRRRQRHSQASGKYTANDIALMYRTQKGLCWWCGSKLPEKYEIDHRVPVSRGGTNDPSNLCLCCRKCNRSKSDKLPGEWNGRLL